MAASSSLLSLLLNQHEVSTSQPGDKAGVPVGSESYDLIRNASISVWRVKPLRVKLENREDKREGEGSVRMRYESVTTRST